MLLTADTKLVDVMRRVVTATNRLHHVSAGSDLKLVEQAGEEHREATAALNEALFERGWRRPGHSAGANHDQSEALTRR